MARGRNYIDKVPRKALWIIIAQRKHQGLIKLSFWVGIHFTRSQTTPLQFLTHLMPFTSPFQLINKTQPSPCYHFFFPKGKLREKITTITHCKRGQIHYLTILSLTHSQSLHKSITKDIWWTQRYMYPPLLKRLMVHDIRLVPILHHFIVL